MLKGNKGEWSELYAFLKVLEERKLFSADEEMERMADNFVFVIAVKRKEKDETKVYSFKDSNDMVFIETSLEKSSVPISDIKRGVLTIFEKMRRSKKGTFEIEEIEPVLDRLKCRCIKASAINKADLEVDVIEPRLSAKKTTLGYSIKSMIGGDSTLLNASKVTNFVFRVCSSGINAEQINQIKTKSKIRDRIRLCGKLEFVRVQNEIFQHNLLATDSKFPEMMAELLYAYYCGKGDSVAELIDVLDSEGIIKEKIGLSKELFVIKVKKFLLDVALGMTPNTKWDGKLTTYGGYIVVKSDGQVVCYHLYNRNQFEDYLFRATRLDTPSSTRHGFGLVYREGSEAMINLNLQIRFDNGQILKGQA